MISSRPENGFVAESPGSSASSRTQGSQTFYPVVVIGRRCKPDQESRRIWKRRHGVTSVIASPAQDPVREVGERTWVKSSDLYQGESLNACVSAGKAAGETAASCRRSLPSTNRASKRVS